MTNKPESGELADRPSTPHDLFGRAMVILKGLSLSVEWELAPSIKKEIDAICKEFEAGRASVVQPSVPASETGWLIEKGQLCLGSWSSKPAWVAFTDPSVIRFARRQDAENMLSSLRTMSDKNAFQECTINDHRCLKSMKKNIRLDVKDNLTG
jgi:hypothetical protein